MLDFVLRNGELSCLNVEILSHHIVSNLRHETHAVDILGQKESLSYSNLTLPVGSLASHVAAFIVHHLQQSHLLPSFVIVPR